VSVIFDYDFTGSGRLRAVRAVHIKSRDVSRDGGRAEEGGIEDEDHSGAGACRSIELCGRLGRA
jgi:hypothetical protein